MTRDLSDKHKVEESRRQLIAEEIARRAAEANAIEAERAREEERTQREQLLVTLNSIGDAVIVTNQRGHVSFLNPVAEQLTGWPLADAIAQPLDTVFKIINEESRRTVESPVDTVFRENRIVELANHTAIIKRDGTEIPIEDSAAPIRSDHGKVTGAILVFRDVTASRRALQDHVRLSAIVESSQDAIIGNDLDGIVYSWNRAAESLYGYASQEIIGRSLSILIPPDHPDDLAVTMERISRGERIEHFETVRLHKNGSRIDVSLSVSPITNEEGRVVGASKIARDISRFKRQEVALRFVADLSKIFGELLDEQSLFHRLADLAVPQIADWCGVYVLTKNKQLDLIQSSISHIDGQQVSAFFGGPSSTADGLARKVMNENVPLLIQNVQEESIALNDQQKALLSNIGIRSCICVPVQQKQESFACLIFAATSSRRQYCSDELSMAIDVAHRTSIAIENYQLYQKVREADRKKDEFLAMLSHELRNRWRLSEVVSKSWRWIKVRINKLYI